MHINDLNGETLKAARERLGLSREKLSEKCGLPVRTIQNIEQGIAENPGLKNIQAMVAALDLEIEIKIEKRPAKTVGEMTPEELAKVIGIAQQLLDQREIQRLRAFEAHIRSFGDDFFDALARLDKYQAIALRAALGLPVHGSASPAAANAQPSKAASQTRSESRAPKKRQASGA
jgi:DNA-binding XRE family transcriptional regulator